MNYPINALLESMTYDTEYEFLEVGKHDDELKTIARQFGLKLPARDLAVFKGRYAVTDKVNRNGCVLPREEVAKALATIRGKAVDFGHIRKRVVGTWIEGRLEGDQIITYGTFFKGNFPEDYETIKQLMSEGNLKISFEAYGERQEIAGTSDYDLTDIEFAGGALLLNEQPAEPTAEVLELAKVLTPPKDFVHTGTNTDKKAPKIDAGTGKMELTEIARFQVHDMETIFRLLGELQDNKGNRLLVSDVLNIDFENSTVKVRAVATDKEGNVAFDDDGQMVEKVLEVQLTPRSKVVENARRVVRISEPTSEKNATESTTQITSTEGKAKEEEETNMEKTTEKVAAQPQVTPEQAEQQAKATELESVKAEVAKLQETLTAKDEEIKSLTERVQGYEKAEQERTLATRREALGEFAKGMKDEELLDNAKFEMAKKDKEIADLQKQLKEKTETASTKGEGLQTGSADKGSTDNDPVMASAKRVNHLAWDEANQKKDE